VKEQTFHRQIADFLTVALGGTATFSTLPLGGGGQLRGAILHGLGVKPGLPDIAVWDAGRTIFLELKAPSGRLSPVQSECHTDLRRARCPVAVVRSLDEVIAFLKAHGVPLRVAA
jgi:hypothetical protein